MNWLEGLILICLSFFKLSGTVFTEEYFNVLWGLFYTYYEGITEIPGLIFPLYIQYYVVGSYGYLDIFHI